MPLRALVLGGGGVAGVAWETGILKGLAEAGVDVAAADAIVGTSAGSLVGAWVAAGTSLDELYRVQAAEEVDPGPRPELDLVALTEIFGRWSAVTEVTPALCAEIGALALTAGGIGEELWLARFAGLLQGLDGWPERRLLVTAVDAADGTFAVWDRDSGVPLTTAVAASCAVPGLVSPLRFGGRRYMDGGVRSTTSADLAGGYDAVLVVAPVGGSPEGIGALVQRQIETELEALRTAGSRVHLIVPDAESLEAFGPDLMDPARRAASARAGLRQGGLEAAGVRDVWSPAPV